MDGGSRRVCVSRNHGVSRNHRGSPVFFFLRRLDPNFKTIVAIGALQHLQGMQWAHSGGLLNLDGGQLIFPIRPGLPERQSHDDTRHGTTTLFAALDTATGKVIGQCHQRHRQDEFIKFLNLIDTQVSQKLDVHLIADNHAIHKIEAVKKWFLKHPRYHIHFTPTSASWLKVVERFFAELTNRQIRRGSFNSVEQLKQTIMDYLDHHNINSKPFQWTATADEILSKVKRFCERSQNSGH